jgi:hypothetical protein
MARRLALLMFLLAGAYVAWQTSQPAMSQQPAEGGPSPQRQSQKQWLGAGSCSSVGCHNANGLKGEPGSEYTTWVLHDRHARAYDVLLTAQSVNIVNKLRRDDGKAAHELALCLNCHVHKDYDKANHHPRFAREDGVGCESCHGPAGGWISDHYKLGLTGQQKTAMGMWDTRSLVGRISTCTPCHVGAKGMEVDHDLIAAGHPRLAFEFSAFHAMMPHHWQDSKDQVPGKSERARSDWDAAMWFVGRAVTAQAALELLAARASGKVWPEFSEYDCYACHHDLRGQGWRQSKQEASQRKAGSLPWNDWYSGTLPFATYPGKVEHHELLQDIASLRTAMESKIVPDREAVRQQVDDLLKALIAWTKEIEKGHCGPADVDSVFMRIADHGATHPAASWDEAAQTYLAAVAMGHASSRAKAGSLSPQFLSSLKDIRALLQFPSDRDSPSADFTPEKLQKLYGQMQKKLR